MLPPDDDLLLDAFEWVRSFPAFSPPLPSPPLLILLSPSCRFIPYRFIYLMDGRQK
jgi:hypothetical protein